MRKIKAYLDLIRFVNSFMSFLAIYEAYYLTGGRSIREGILLGGAGFLITAAGNIFNDIMDIEVDLENKPSRPLPSGKVSLFEARFLVFLFNLSGLVLSFNISIFKGSVALIAIIILYLYNGIYKTKGFIGNLMVAFNTALLFIFGAVSPALKVIFLISIAFLLSISREMVKDYEDREGDIWRDYNTVKINFSNLLLWDRVLSVLLLVPLTIFLLYSSASYKFIFYPLSILLLFYSHWFLLKKEISKSVRIKKITMLFGLIMILFS